MWVIIIVFKWFLYVEGILLKILSILEIGFRGFCVEIDLKLFFLRISIYSYIRDYVSFRRGKKIVVLFICDIYEI